MHVHLDTIGGIAGDMFVAACLDAWPELAAGTEDAMRAAGLPPTWRVEVAPAHSHAIAGTRVAIRRPADPSDQPSGAHSEIRRRLHASSLEHAVRDRALDIFQRLADAEARAHGVTPDEVHFHEIADWDSVADIAGAAYLIDASGVTSWSVSPLPMGGGSVSTAHGRLPVPAPAVVRLLDGYPMVDDGVGGERVTPTGAAIVAHLEPRVGGAGAGIIGRTGHGLGTRDLPDRPNLLRLLELLPTEHPVAADKPWDTARVSVISFDVDDQTAEDLAVGLEAIRLMEGVLDIVQSPVMAKKGRMATQVRVLCRPEVRQQTIRACFDQTTTIGLRWHDETRAELDRADVMHDGIRGKAARRPGGVVTTKPDSDAIAEAATTSSERAQARRRFAAAEPDRGTDA